MLKSHCHDQCYTDCQQQETKMQLLPGSQTQLPLELICYLTQEG